MSEIENKNRLAMLIKAALEIKKISLEQKQGFLTRVLAPDPIEIQNMRNIVNNKEIQILDYLSFFNFFTKFLNEELLNKQPSKRSFEGERYRDLVTSNKQIIFELEGLSEEKILEKNEHAVYLKILTILSNTSFSALTISTVLQMVNALEYFDKSNFLQNNFSLLKINAIYSSLNHAKPLIFAKLLVFLNQCNLLTLENLKKIEASKLDIKLFTIILNKLHHSGGEKHLLNQANLNKLLQNSALAKIADLFRIFAASKILTQDNFDHIISFNKVDLEKIFPVLVTMLDKKILNQANFLSFLETFLAVSIRDAHNADSDSIDGQLPKTAKNSLADGLCSTLLDFLSRVQKFCQKFFDDILKYFNDKAQTNETAERSKPAETTGNNNSFFSDAPNTPEKSDINELKLNAPFLISAH